MITLRPYQEKLIAETSALMHNGVKSICIQSPTGSGKTALVAHMFGSAAAKGMPSWFVVHRRELIKQAIKAFNTEGLKFGVIANGFPEDRQHLIQIASVQTLANQMSRHRAPRMVAFDEAHHCAAKSWDKVYHANSETFNIGLTATPARLDGKGLDKYFKALVVGPTVPWLIENGYLSKYRLFVPAGGIDTDGLHKRMGDYVTSEVAQRADKPTITGSAIREYKKYAMGKRAVMFTTCIAHSKHVVEEFNAAGIPAAHVDGETDTKERDKTIADFEAGRVLILSNVELFGEGFDLPAIEVVGLLRPTLSEMLYLQQVGRALRPSPGKDTAIILDHAGNCQRHGLPDEERTWKLERRDASEHRLELGEKQTRVRVCPHCFAAVSGYSTACRFCGHVFSVEGRHVAVAEGDLVEMKAEMIRRKKKVEEWECKTLEQLTALGRARGYDYPYIWAKHKMSYRAKKQEGRRDSVSKELSLAMS